MPALQSKLVQEVLKENYDFGFAMVKHEIYDETELEESLTKNITDLLLEMGTGFAFVGRQKEILVGGRTRKIDLLFYHIRLRCYIVCEPPICFKTAVNSPFLPSSLTRGEA